MIARLLILGAGGQLARALRERAGPAGLEERSAGRTEANLAERGAVSALIDSAKPDAVINAAAFTDVDGAENNPALAVAINSDGAGEAALAARRVGARFVHVSTDYVFSGGGPHAEDASPDPANAYGHSKLAGERAVLAAFPDAAIVRASGIFSGGGRDFPSAMWRLAYGSAPIRVVDDQRVTPIWADALADRLLALALRPEASGLFHAATPGASWFEVAGAALEILADAGGPKRVPELVASAEFPRPAPRPSDSRLAGARLSDVTGLSAPDWRDGLKPALQRWLAVHGRADG